MEGRLKPSGARLGGTRGVRGQPAGAGAGGGDAPGPGPARPCDRRGRGETGRRARRPSGARRPPDCSTPSGHGPRGPRAAGRGAGRDRSRAMPCVSSALPRGRATPGGITPLHAARRAICCERRWRSGRRRAGRRGKRRARHAPRRSGDRRAPSRSARGWRQRPRWHPRTRRCRSPWSGRRPRGARPRNGPCQPAREGPRVAFAGRARRDDRQRSSSAGAGACRRRDAPGAARGHPCEATVSRERRAGNRGLDGVAPRGKDPRHSLHAVPRSLGGPARAWRAGSPAWRPGAGPRFDGTAVPSNGSSNERSPS